MVTRRALLIATDRYEAPDLGRLRAPGHDVDALGRVLADPRIGDFEVQRVVNRPAHEISAVIEDFFCDRRSDDELLLYFSCHGVKDDAGRLYFAAVNTQLNRLGSSAVAASYVTEQLKLSMSRKIILVLDCCYSGAFTMGMLSRGSGTAEIGERLGGSGTAIICSSTALEYSFELDERHIATDVSLTGAGGAGRPSIFTDAVVQGLLTGDADRDGDGHITVDELYDYVYNRVVETTPKQTPNKFADVRGDLVIAYSPKRRVVAALPAEVTSAVEHPLAGVRRTGVDVLKGLVLSGDGTAELAYGRLRSLLDDDSRSVAAHARAAIEEIEGDRSYSRRPGAVPAPLGVRNTSARAAPVWSGPPVGSGPVETVPPAGNFPAPMPPPVWRPSDRPRPPYRDMVSLTASVMPFFSSLFFVVNKRREVRFFALQCALIDVFTIALFIAGAIPVGIYSTSRYGEHPIPESDPVLNAYMALILLLPFLLRAYCFVRLFRCKRAYIPVLGALAGRLAYRKPRSR